MNRNAKAFVLCFFCFIIVSSRLLGWCVCTYIRAVANMSDVEGQEHYDSFFEEVFVELNDKVPYYAACHRRVVSPSVCSLKKNNKNKKEKNILCRIGCNMYMLPYVFKFGMS